MSGLPRAEANPFQAPTSPSLAPEPEPIPDAEIIRRSFLAHESKVRSLGLLVLTITALSGLLAAVFTALALGQGAFQLPGQRFPFAPAEALVVAGFLAFVALVSGVIGFGLLRLTSWTRWVAVLAVGLAFVSYLARYAVALALGTRFFARPGQVVGNTIALFISGYALMLLFSSRSGRVFSRDYRAIIRQTPEIRPYVSTLAKVVLGSTLALILMMLLAFGLGLARRG